MGFYKKKEEQEASEAPTAAPPKLVRRKDNKNSAWKSGRTIGERREKLETASERAAAHKKNEKKRKYRFGFTVLGFTAVAFLIVWSANFFFKDSNPANYTPEYEIPFAPTVEVIDEAGGNNITSRMREYIGQAEADFRELGYRPVKVVVPKGGVREVDFYLDEHPGFIKLVIDRPTGVSVEDADRMIRYLAGQGVAEYSYIDVRIDGKAYWK